MRSGLYVFSGGYILDKKYIQSYINSNITIIIDTREKKCEHIVAYLDKNRIKHITQKLDVGDYSFTFNEMNYSDEIVIERKASLDEIVGNFTGHVLSTKKDEKGNFIKLSNRDRFEREFLRMQTSKKYLLIENASWEKIYRHGYRSQLPPESLAASMYTFQHRFKINTIFASREYTPQVIYGVFFYYLREKILNKEVMV